MRRSALVKVPSFSKKDEPGRNTCANFADSFKTYIRHNLVGSGQIRGRYARDSRVLFKNGPIRDEYLIVDGGKLAGTGARSYSTGNATGGSKEAAKFKRA